jgi:hypothetical protein
METITPKPYETDLTDDEWAIREPVLQRALYGDKTKTRAHPRRYPLRRITNAIMLDGIRTQMVGGQHEAFSTGVPPPEGRRSVGG